MLTLKPSMDAYSEPRPGGTLELEVTRDKQNLPHPHLNPILVCYFNILLKLICKLGGVLDCSTSFICESNNLIKQEESYILPKEEELCDIHSQLVGSQAVF